jgi:DNA replication protein DnaC
LFLEGQPGVGKTHLAVAVLKQVIQTTGARGVFYDTRDLLRVIRSTYDAPSEPPSWRCCAR